MKEDRHYSFFINPIPLSKSQGKEINWRLIRFFQVTLDRLWEGLWWIGL